MKRMLQHPPGRALGVSSSDEARATSLSRVLLARDHFDCLGMLVTLSLTSFQWRMRSILNAPAILSLIFLPSFIFKRACSNFPPFLHLAARAPSMSTCPRSMPPSRACSASCTLIFSQTPPKMTAKTPRARHRRLTSRTEPCVSRSRGRSTSWTPRRRKHLMAPSPPPHVVQSLIFPPRQSCSPM